MHWMTLCVKAEASALAAAAPLVDLVAAGLQRLGLQLLPLHRATSKLGHVVTSLLAGLVQEGFCRPPDAADGALPAPRACHSLLHSACTCKSCHVQSCCYHEAHACFKSVQILS